MIYNITLKFPKPLGDLIFMKGIGSIITKIS